MVGKKPYEEAWEILTEVAAELHEEEDSKGDLKANGEARALNWMKNALQREIAKDATTFLKQHGFNGRGERGKPRRRK